MQKAIENRNELLNGSEIEFFNKLEDPKKMGKLTSQIAQRKTSRNSFGFSPTTAILNTDPSLMQSLLMQSLEKTDDVS